MTWRNASLACAMLMALAPASAQTFEYKGDYRTDVPHPRLFLPQRRLRLLQREPERESLRWVQFHTLIRAKAKMAEPGFALALYSVAAKSNEHGRAAVEWALGPAATDLRQLAIVFDWCQPLLTPDESRRLAAKIAGGLEKSAAAADLPSVSRRVLAALALSGHVEGVAEKYLKPTVEKWWTAAVVAPIQAGQVPIELKDHLAMIEMFHALRDNFDIDLRETAAKHFTVLPIYHLLAHYPAPFPAPENEYRIPLMKGHAEPDLREAARSRAAALAMVAYDNNSQEMQFLQGWLIQDRFLMRGTYGIPYEYLWANPYQPGLSFHYLPNVFHDPASGRLIIRSTWEDDAVWYFQAPGVMQMFENGRVVNLQREAMQRQIVMGNTALLPAAMAADFRVDAGEQALRYYVFGLRPSAAYDLEIDDEELREVRSDPGGVVELAFAKERKTGVILRPAPGSKP